MSMEKSAERLAEDVWTAVRKFHNECRPSDDEANCENLPMWIELNKEQKLAFCVYFSSILSDLTELAHYVTEGEFVIVPNPHPEMKPENN